ncbi:hypothetical protein ABT119_40015 [Streptomyces sp. NPDC001910]|uniref:hypothetical protein n=1 Tax=Streptomyces sp. NPDC001910 TaxID=3154403 RepID=UPI0033180029
MTHTPADRHTPPTPAELREQLEHTRHELGVQDLADNDTDARGRTRQKASELRDHALARAGELKVQAAKATSQVQNKVPDSVKEKAAQAAGQTRAAAAYARRMWHEKVPEPLQNRTVQLARHERENRTVVLTAAAGTAVLWLVGRRAN